MHDRRAATERGARASGVCANSARARRDVRQQARGVHVRWIVVRRGARLQYENAQIWVRGREAARDDAASGAAYRMSSWSKQMEGGE